MSSPDFEVVISGGHISQEAWLKANGSRKPELSDEQKEVARKLGVADEEYARGVVAMQLGEEAERGRGRILGERIRKILESLGPEYKLDAVIRQGTQLRWLARIEVGGKIFAVAIPMELADDITDAGSDRDMNRLKNLVFFGVGRQDLMLKR